MNAQDSAPKGDPSKTATLLISNKQTIMPVRSGSIGPDVIDIGKLYANTGCFTYDPGFTSTANCSSQASPTSTATRACCSIAATRSSSWPRSRTSSRSATCCCTANCRPRRSSTNFRQHHHAPHDGARADDPVLHRLPPRRASDGDHVRRRSARCRPSITTAPTSTIRSSA